MVVRINRPIVDSNPRMADCWAKEEADLLEIKKWIYDNANSRLWKKYLYWKNELHLPEKACTLEAGCGYGKFSMLLGLAGENVTLLDYNSTALESAVKAHNKIGLNPRKVEGDLVELSQNMRDQYDVVCSFGTLEHFAGRSRLRAFEANSRFLKKGGLLFFTVPNQFGVFYRIAFGIRKMLGLVPKNFFEKPFSAWELRRLASSSGIHPLEIGCVGTLKEDFKYWIGENARSLLRKIGIIGQSPVQSHRDVQIETIDLSGDAIEIRNNILNRFLSYNLLFVGTKTA